MSSMSQNAADHSFNPVTISNGPPAKVGVDHNMKQTIYLKSWDSPRQRIRNSFIG
jgi:hypothetical protein